MLQPSAASQSLCALESKQTSVCGLVSSLHSSSLCICSLPSSLLPPTSSLPLYLCLSVFISFFIFFPLSFGLHAASSNWDVFVCVVFSVLFLHGNTLTLTKLADTLFLIWLQVIGSTCQISGSKPPHCFFLKWFFCYLSCAGLQIFWLVDKTSICVLHPVDCRIMYCNFCQKNRPHL